MTAFETDVRAALGAAGVDAASPLLVALSGGMDSTVLLHVCHKLGYTVAAAHMNYGLRGAESDADEAHCRAMCLSLGVPLHVAHRSMAGTHPREGIQAAAREARYTWLHELCRTHRYQAIATAHHLQDQAETVLMQLARGAGIKGLGGMQLLNGLVVRPLLSIRREVLAAYAKWAELPWRHDRSNDGDAYLRNRTRHHLLPHFEALRPHALENIARSATYLQTVQRYLDAQARAFLAAQGHQSVHGVFHLPEAAARELFHSEPLAVAALGLFQFPPAALASLTRLLDAIPGRMAEGPRYHAYRTATGMAFGESHSAPVAPTELHLPKGELTHPIHLSWSMEQLPAEAPAQANPREAWLDAAVLTEPLVLRAWQPGDRLHPTGMQGSKKVSDLLTDQKLSLPDKRRVLLLCHGRAVCWVVGYRQAITLRAVTPGAPALRVRWHSEQLPPHPVLTPHGQ